MRCAVLVAIFLSLAFHAAIASEEAEELSGSSGCYVGAAASLTLPQGGSRMRRLGGGALRAGWYIDEHWAVEGEAAWLENVAGLGVDLLWHLHGWSLYDDLFGYSQFDPFVTAGARGWIGDAGQVGPLAGAGAFWHLSEEWALRFDAGATLCLDSRTEVAYSFAVGVQRSF